MNDSGFSRLATTVGLVAAAMLVIEVVITRIFSVLFYYHYSFFAVSLVMSGLAIGGLWAARWNAPGLSAEDFAHRVASLSQGFAACTLIALLHLAFAPYLTPYWLPEQLAGELTPSLELVAGVAVSFLPGLVAAGALLALAFARNQTWIGRLYAADLVAAALACVSAVVLLRALQGPGALLVAVLMAALGGLVIGAGSKRLSALGLVLSAAAAIGIGAAVSTGENVLDVAMAEHEAVDLERWNEHSRIAVIKEESRYRPDAYHLVIDRGALTTLIDAGIRREGEPLRAPKAWGEQVHHVAFELKRPWERTAVIGVGGGIDVMAALSHGAEHVDGYELNGILVDLIRTAHAGQNNLADWPEVSLIHDEGRVGIERSGHRYDLIQASLIDTWASTAAGGYVLSENALYTVDAWRTFFEHLDDDGVLSMTRWYLPDVPAEAQRLLSLAVKTLLDEGVTEPARHIMLIGSGAPPTDEPAPDDIRLGTIIVSPSPFSAAEIARMEAQAEKPDRHIVLAPGHPPADATMRALLDPGGYEDAVAASRYDLSAPTDERPYFFLQVRMQNLLDVFDENPGTVLQLTFSAVRVLFGLGLLSLLFALLVLAISALTQPSANATETGRRIYRRMVPYFACIGLGYILVQLSLHQALIMKLGHPTYALSVVLFSMLLGTGLGAALSDRVFRDGRFGPAWASIVGVLFVVWLILPLLGVLDGIASPTGRAAAAAIFMGLASMTLGFGFPLGVRLVAPTGEWAVQKLWAVNGAAGIAGTSLAAILGLAVGSRHVMVGGIVCYVIAGLCGLAAQRLSPNAPSTSPP